MLIQRSVFWALLGVVVLSGCANNAYLLAKQRTAAGGELETQQAAADRALQDELRRQAELKRQQERTDSEIALNSQRIAALQGDLRKQEAQLKAALNGRKITKAQHDQLKRQLDGLRTDAQRADMENQGSASSKTPAGDPARQAELAKLEERKKALEKALATMTAR